MRNDLEGNGDIGLIASLMPNQTRANLMRATAWFCLSISLLFGLPLARIVFHDLYARVSWPVADGAVRGYQQESGEEHASGTRSTGGASWPVYWIEFEVGLDIPAGNCRTGTTIGGRAELPCLGTDPDAGDEILGGGTELGRPASAQFARAIFV